MRTKATLEPFEDRARRFVQFCGLLPAMYRRRLSKYQLDRIRQVCVGPNLVDIDSLEQFQEKALDICVTFARLFPEEVDRMSEPWRGAFRKLAEEVSP